MKVMYVLEVKVKFRLSLVFVLGGKVCVQLVLQQLVGWRLERNTCSQVPR